MKILIVHIFNILLFTSLALCQELIVTGMVKIKNTYDVFIGLKLLTGVEIDNDIPSQEQNEIEVRGKMPSLSASLSNWYCI